MSQAARTGFPDVKTQSTAPPLSVFREQRDDRRLTTYEAQVWAAVDEIDTTAWNHLRTPHDLFMDVRLLRAVEASMARDATFRYVLFRDADGKPAASACLCTYSVDGTVLVEKGFARRMACALKRISPVLVTYKIVFCGLPFSGGQSHLRFAEGVDQRAILTALDGMLRTIAREDGAKCIVLKEFQEHELSAVEAAGDLGYLRADSLPMNQLGLEHADFEGFLGSLHNKKRYEARKSIKKFSEGGLRMVTTSDPDEVDRLFTPEVHRMYDAVVSRSDTKLEMLPVEFFREMVRQLPGNCEISFAMDGDTVRGFGLCLFSETEYHPLFLGVDYDRNRDYDLYFNMMYASVAEALRNRTKLVLLGQNADQCKTIKLTSYQTPRFFYIKGVGFIMENVIRLLSKQLFPARPVTVPFPG
jgi:predicted N-acyltransferase